MDKIDAFYELEKRYDNLQLNYDFSIKINGHFKINIDFYNEPNNEMTFEMVLNKDDSLELIHVMAVPENKMHEVIKCFKRLINCYSYNKWFNGDYWTFDYWNLVF